MMVIELLFIFVASLPIITDCLPCQIDQSSGGPGISGTTDIDVTNFNEACDGVGCLSDCSGPAESYVLPLGGAPSLISGLTIGQTSDVSVGAGYPSSTTLTITLSTGFSAKPVSDAAGTDAVMRLRCKNFSSNRHSTPFGSCKWASNTQVTCTNIMSMSADCYFSLGYIRGPPTNGQQNSATWTALSTKLLTNTNPAGSISAIIPDYVGMNAFYSTGPTPYFAVQMTASGKKNIYIYIY